MAHIDAIGAGIYTELAFKAGTVLPIAVDAAGYTKVEDIREFPSFLAPANIVNVPQYGQSQSSQISGQADAPTLEFTINYNPDKHNAVADLVGDGITYIIKFTLANEELPATLLATTKFDDFYVLGRFAAFQVSPNLTDANQATLTLSTIGDFSKALTLS